MGYLFQILSVFSFGAGNVLWKFLGGTTNIFHVIAVRSFLTTFLFLILWLIEFDLKGTSFDYTFTIVLCAISFWGLYFFNLSIRNSKATFTVTVAGLNSMFGIITGILVFNEHPSTYFYFALLLVFVGLFLLEENSIRQLSIGNLYALLAAMIWGSTFALFKIPIQRIGTTSFSFLLEATVFGMSGILLTKSLIDKNQRIRLKKSEFKILFFLAFTTFLGVNLFSQAVQLIPITQIALISSFTPVVSIILSRLLLKESITLKQGIGIGLINLGIIGAQL